MSVTTTANAWIALREAALAYFKADAEPGYSWVIESEAARHEGRPNREVERMQRVAEARQALATAVALAEREEAPCDPSDRQHANTRRPSETASSGSGSTSASAARSGTRSLGYNAENLRRAAQAALDRGESTGTYHHQAVINAIEDGPA